ncbi:hypothetical protein ScPMuIL_007229 [Solemya velum]
MKKNTTQHTMLETLSTDKKGHVDSSISACSAAEKRQKRGILSYIVKKLESLVDWLDRQENATVFDYIYTINQGAGLNLYQGDIQGYNPRLRNAVVSRNQLWNNRIVPYTIDPSFDAKAMEDVTDAIAEHNAKTCVRWVPRTNENDYIFFTPGDTGGCYSTIGHYQGEQKINLGKGCIRAGTVMHEMMHGLGFWHEQSRPDRDSFVQIVYNNIIAGKEKNFDKLPVDQADTLNLPYDYGSVMHYSKTAFSKNFRDPTIIPKQKDAKIGQRNGLSQLDIQKINKLYQCGQQAITAAPTQRPPTQSPVTTQRQTQAPTVRPPTQAPVTTQRQTQAPTVRPPTQAPVTTQRQTQAPTVRPPTQAPTTQRATQAPTTQRPTQVPTTQRPTQAPTTQKPTQAPTQRPTTVQPGAWTQWGPWNPCNMRCEHTRYRFCTNRDSRYCPGSTTETKTCGPPCQPVTQLGCWTNNLTMSIIPSVEQHTQSLADPYKLRTAALRQCADVASVLGYTAFALMDGGKCLTGPTANQIYSNNGRSSDCGYYGKGGLTGMSVYSFQTDIDGEWGVWSQWGECTRDCGGGDRFRYRDCDSPSPVGHGADCSGVSMDQMTCNTQECASAAKCGVRFHTGRAGTSGVIHVPSYDNNMNCEFQILTGDPQLTISIAITNIDVEFSRGCMYDSLTFYDGQDVNGRVLGSYCGTRNPIPFQSSHNSMYISFQTDATGTGQGFTFFYTINARTKRACIEPPPMAHGTKTGTSNFIGDTISFKCDPHFLLHGSPSISCVDQPAFAMWSDDFPQCKFSRKRRTAQVEEQLCTFEDNLCGFTQTSGDDFNWKVMSAIESYQLQSPEADLSPGANGNFLYAEAPRDSVPGALARIQSKLYEASTSAKCLSFWYGMVGELARLSIYVTTDETEKNIFDKTGETEIQGQTAIISIPTTRAFKITFEALVGDQIGSSVSLDDVTVSKCL